MIFDFQSTLTGGGGGATHCNRSGRSPAKSMRCITLTGAGRGSNALRWDISPIVSIMREYIFNYGSVMSVISCQEQYLKKYKCHLLVVSMVS